MQFSKFFLKKSIGINNKNKGQFYDNNETNNETNNVITNNNIKTNNNAHFSATNFYLEQSEKEREKIRSRLQAENRNRQLKEKELKELKERELKERELKERERELKEKELKERERELKEREREPKERERELKERELKERERELKERELKEKEKELKEKEKELKERELKEKELKERELRERQLTEKERQLKERELKEREIRDRQIKERELKERQLTERELKEREIRDRQLTERETQLTERERELKEREIRDRQIRERELKERDLKEREIREREIKEREIRDRQIRERELKEREVKERERQLTEKERDLKERELKLKELKDIQIKEREIRERELKERERQLTEKERDLKERELKERQIKDRQIKEKELKEKELKDREREIRERELKEKEPREIKIKREIKIEREIKEIENMYQEKYNNINASGLGDFIRGSYFLMEFCDKNNISFNINILNHPISQFLEIYQNKQPSIINNINRFEEVNFQPHISNNDIITNIYDSSTNNKFINYLNKQHVFNKKIYTYIISYPSEKIDENHKEYMKQILKPCKQLELLVDNMLLELQLVKKQFIIIHIRYGDDFLINKKSNIENNHLAMIQKILNKLDLNQKYLLISDNIIIKNILSLKYPFIKTHFNRITHTGEGEPHTGGKLELETIKLQNTMIDFNMFSHASSVIAFSIYKHGTGFSRWITETYSVPYICRFLP